MSDNEFIGDTFRRAANDRFWIAPLQDEIDTRVFDTYTVRDLRRLCQLASAALRRSRRADDIYGEEVFVVPQEDTPVYYVEPDGYQLRVTYGEETTLHGYIRSFEVQTLPDHDGKQALVAGIEELFEDTRETQSYYIPLAIEGSSRGSRLHDAPVPVVESDVELDLDAVYTRNADQQGAESDEQAVQWSLLNIIEQDLFGAEGGVATTRQLSEQAMRLVEAGFIDDIDDFATACNYYLAARAHVNDAMHLDVHGGAMLSLDGPIGEIASPVWVEERLELGAVDFEVDKAGLVAMTVYCYKRTEEGVEVYSSDSAETEDWGFTTWDADTGDGGDEGE